MDRISEHTARPSPAEALAVSATQALYAVTDMLAAARRAGSRIGIDAGEFCIEALAQVADAHRRPLLEPVREAGGNVVPFPVRRR